VPNGGSGDVDFQENLSGNPTLFVTNFLANNPGSINYLRMITTNGNLTVTTASGVNWFTEYGGVINTGDTFVVNGGSVGWSEGNNSFNDTGGTLVISNGGSVFVNLGANALQNTGTITLTATNTQTSQINYGQASGGPLTNESNGIIIKTGAGLGTFEGNYGANNLGVFNNGTIIVNGGTLDIDSANAFNGAFINTGTILVNSSTANFVIGRTASAWGGGEAPTNSGTIFMNGGTITAYVDTSGVGATNQVVNTGAIVGNGVVALSVAQGSSGSTIASNGTLSVFGMFNGGQATFTSSSSSFGTMKAVSGGDLQINGNIASGNEASWVVNSGGTLEVAAGASADLGAAFMPASQLNGTVLIDAGANMTLSAGTTAGVLADGVTVGQNGTFMFNGGTSGGNSAIYIPNQTALPASDAFTNAGTFVVSAGNATFETGFGANNLNWGFVNAGAILATNSGSTFFVNAGQAYYNAFSNAVGGTIVISNGATVAIQRTTAAWDLTGTGSGFNANVDSNVVNSGNILLNNGTFALMDSTSGNVTLTNYFRNAGTISVVGSQTGYIAGAMTQLGTLALTNNLSVLSYLGTNAMTNSGTILLGANGSVATMIASNIGAHGNSLFNTGTIEGQGTLTLGLTNGSGGANANFVNSGLLIATNWGGSTGNSLFISVGNAFSNGGFSNTAAGTIVISSNMTLTVNRTENAWANSGNSVANLGTITMQGGSLNLAADGAVSNAASFINSGLISGYGTINSVVITTNNGSVFAVATNLSSVGTLTLSVASTTNNSSATLGVVGTNSVLNILTPGNQNVLLNYGTISVSGGSINFNGGTGTITNFYIVAGVGNLSSFGIVSTGTLASLVAQGPISGLSNLIATVGTINTALLGANSNVSAAATLTLGTTSGGGLINNGTIALQGGFITVTNAAGVDAGITNQTTGLIYGTGTQSVSVVNLTGGTLLASNGILRLGMSGANAGVITNLNSASTVILTNTTLRNTGTIALNGGGLIMGGSTITNDGTIIGPGNYSSGLYNNPDGTVIAQNGTLAIATNGATESVNNLGTFSIASASTLSVGTAWNNTNGVVSLSGGTLAGSAVTNKGTISGNGTIDGILVNAAGGTLTASGGTLTLTNNPTQNGNVAVTSGSTLTMALSGGAFTNGGTINLSGGVMVFTNTVAGASFTGTFLNNGVIAGFGTNSLNPTFNLHEGSGVNPNFVNAGVILASNGLLMINAADSFTQGGFSNAANGTIAVSNGATFAVNKTANYWNNSGPLANQGTIVLNGGTVTLYDNGAETNGGLNANIGIVNNGTIFAQGTGPATNTWGSGLLNAGTIYVTNNTSVFNVLTMNALTNTATGQIFLGGNGAVGTLIATNVGQNGNSLANLGIIEGQGTITLGVTNATGGANAHLLNSGTLIATNWGGASGGTLFISTGNAFSGGGFENLAAGVVQVATNMTLEINRSYNAWANSGNTVTNLGTITMGGGTLEFAADGVQSNAAGFINNGSITGNGVIIAGFTNAATGTIAPTGGTLTIDGSGGFGNSGTLAMNTGNTLILTNLGAGTGLTFSNAGTIQMSGGLLTAGIITNAGTISGFGTISGGGVVNGGFVLAITNGANVGTLTVQMNSATNANGATVGTIGTNAVLNLLTPGGSTYVNNGTISVSGGTILLNNSTGTISNFNTIAGVGNVASLSVVNAGGASFVAQNPISGLSNLIASLNGNVVTNSGLLGANSGATLQLTVGGGGTTDLVNHGRIALNGGFITFNGGQGAVSNISGGIIYGTNSTPGNLNVANVGGTIMASNGTLRLGMFGANSGVISNLNAASTIILTNTVLQNTGTIALNGGGLVMGGSTITNDGTIIGPGNYSSGLYNDTIGTVIAQNGTLNIATNGATESVNNLGNFSIASASTLNVAPDWNNTSGLISLGGGTLSGGAVTNSGTILGNGTITSSALVNGAAGTVKATNGVLAVNAAAVTQNGTMIGGSASGTYLQVTNVTGALVNNGTIVMDGSGNLGLYALQTLTNTANGTIKGAGIVRTADSVIGGGGKDFSVINQGTILATNGTLIVDTGDAFTQGGFNNAAGATVTVANASTFGISRSTNAWVNAPTNTSNSGVIQLFGGTVQTYTNTGTGTTATPVADNTRVISNAASGLITGNGSLNFNLVNLGTVNATNGTLVMAGTAQFSNNGTLAIQNGATLTTLQTAGNFQNNAQMLFLGGTFVGTNYTSGLFMNAGTISGNGSLNTGEVSGNDGQNENIVNAGAIIATNGTLFVNPGDAFSSSGFSNGPGGTITIATNAAFVLNRTVNAWSNYGVFPGPVTNGNPVNAGMISLQGGSWSNYAGGVSDASRFLQNAGTISGFGVFSGSVTNQAGATIHATGGTLALQGTGAFGQQGTLEVDGGATMLVSNANGLASVNNAGTINMNGGTLLAGAVTNANWIFGNGSITGSVASGVINLSDSFLYASNGVLSASLGSFTNGVGVTMGTLGTNATLNVQMPGGITQPLINLGTLSFAGGTLLANGTSSGTISNEIGGVILGVGNVTQTVANNGTILAADPVGGLNVFSVGLSSVNSATIGASNGAILNVVLSGGAGSTFNNNGSIVMIGGALVISNGTPGLITNNFFVSGVGTITPNIVNNGTIQATVNGGALDVSLLGGTNISSGYLSAGTGATLQFENSSLVNLGTIGPVGAGGGTIQFGPSVVGGILSNQGTIQGINGLAFNTFVQNNNYIYATNGEVSFNAVNGLANAGTINISNGGTLQSNSSNSWSNAGTINLLGGTLRTGGYTNAASSAIFTNSSLIAGYGTIIGGGAYGQTGAGFDKSFANLGTILATNPISGTSQTLYISTGGATSGNGIENLGTMIVSSNNTLALDRDGLPILNTGTITINDGTLASTSTITNTLGGIIQGYGTLTASIVNQSGGTIRATNGLLSMTSTVYPINAGTMEIDNGATLTWDATNSWQNNGTVSLLGGTLRTGGPTNAFAGGEPFTNSSTGYIIGYGTLIGGGAYGISTSGFDKAILNLGTIVADGGTLVINTGDSILSNGIANFGTMIVSNATDTLVLERSPTAGTNNFIINTGTIQINGGTLTADTGITNQFVSASLPGLIQGFGTIALTNLLNNSGTIRSTNTSVSGSGVLQFVNPAGSALQINQGGTLVVEGGSQMIFGSNTNAPLLNSGTIVMNGGMLSSGMLTNDATFRGFGTITSSIINSGTGLATSLSAPLYLTGSTIYNQNSGVLGANNGQLVVNTVFTNAGTVSFVNSLGTFNNAVVNQGAWISDPSTNMFLGTYTVATNGYINMAAGDVYMFQSNFVNVSSLSNQYNTLNGKFVMNGQGTQQFYVAGLNLGGFASSIQPSNETYFSNGSGTFSTNSFAFARGDAAFGYSNNFALGTLELSDLSTTVLMDTYGTVGSNDNQVAGLYLNTLTLDPGSLLIISNNVELYFETTNGVTGVGYGTLGAGDDILMLDGSSFHQLTVVPEPSILMLFSVGTVAIVGYRRRKARLSAKR